MTFGEVACGITKSCTRAPSSTCSTGSRSNSPSSRKGHRPRRRDQPPRRPTCGRGDKKEFSAMAFQRTAVELVDLTPEIAAEIAAMPAFAGERELKATRLAFFQAHLTNGTFIGPEWTVAVHRTTGARYRANGHHSSTFLCHLPPEAFPKNVQTGAWLKVTINTIEFDSLEEDSFDIFNLFDHPKSARTNTDVMGLYRSHWTDLSEIPNSHLVNVANGIIMYERNRETPLLLAPRSRGGYWDNEVYREFARWTWGFTDTEHDWMLKKSGLVAEMLDDRLTDAAAADEFWTLVVTESHPDSEHETRELSRELLRAKSRPRVTQQQFRREAAKSWRRYRRSTPPP